MSEQSQEGQRHEDWHEREVAHLRQVISTAKVVVTLTSAIAATFVAAELQIDERNHWEQTAALLMVLALGATIWVVALRSPSHEHELDTAKFIETKTVAERAHRLMVAQVGFSAVSSVVAALGLLIP